MPTMVQTPVDMAAPMAPVPIARRDTAAVRRGTALQDSVPRPPMATRILMSPCTWVIKVADNALACSAFWARAEETAVAVVVVVAAMEAFRPISSRRRDLRPVRYLTPITLTAARGTSWLTIPAALAPTTDSLS